jgi:tetratricopeptide (TPR) repeat protein
MFFWPIAESFTTAGFTGRKPRIYFLPLAFSNIAFAGIAFQVLLLTASTDFQAQARAPLEKAGMDSLSTDGPGISPTTFSSSSSTTLVDSLQKQLTKGLSDPARIECLNRLAREYVFISAAKAADYSQQALVLSVHTGNTKGQAYAYRNLASMYAAQESFYLSLEFAGKAMGLFQQLGDQQGIGNCYITLGLMYKNQEQYAKAVELNTKALAIFKRLGLPERQAVALHNLGDVEFLAGSSEQAKTHLSKATDLCISLSNHSVLTACYRAMGRHYFQEKRFDKAVQYFNKAIEISQLLSANAQKEATTESLIYLARLAGQDKRQQDQLAYLQQALALASAFSLAARMPACVIAGVKPTGEPSR